MADGVMVLDRGGRIFEINRAAEHMLGGIVVANRSNAALSDIPALRPISEELSAWHQGIRLGSTITPNAAVVTIRFFDESRQLGLVSENAPRRDFVTHLKLRFVAVDDAGLGGLVGLTGASQPETYTIIFMRDVSEIENQAQQLKLASMGRLTASIAHEVRNPLSSISYAASLLSEDLGQEPQARRLLKIVDDNVLRLNKLIEDILKLSRKVQAEVEPYQLMAAVRGMVSELNETRTLAADLIYVDESISFEIDFDPEHLREVVMNLLSNALRYASGKPRSIRIWANMPALDRKELHIQDDGPGITYEVRSHLFEPFYTTSSKGTGLGLYMARELCLNNRALLDYEYRVDETAPARASASGRFVINFSVPDMA
jgi:two-component system sensor histidine kinase PilS (NtrC family)